MNDMPQSSFGLEEIGQIAVPVRDLDRAVRFYRDTLGMRFLFQAPPGLGFFDCAGIRLMLDAPAKAQAGNSSVIYYRVSDLRLAHETLSARGVVSSKSLTKSRKCRTMICGWPSFATRTPTCWRSWRRCDARRSTLRSPADESRRDGTSWGSSRRPRSLDVALQST